MRSPAYRIAALVLVSTFAPAFSCSDRTPPPAPLSPPADLLQRADKPVLSVEGANSEAAFERWREDVNDHSDAGDGIIDRACWWFQDAGIRLLTCRPRPPQP